MKFGIFKFNVLQVYKL